MSVYAYTPTDALRVAVKHILRYLEGIFFSCLHIICNSSFTLHGFANANWASNVDYCKLTCGYLVYFGCTTISWKLGKQHTVARSLTKSKYKAFVDRLLRSYSFYIYWQICKLLILLYLCFGVIIWVPLICPSILFFMFVLNIWRLTIILYVIGLPRKTFRFASFLLRINL
jgi:hypothetical protein